MNSTLAQLLYNDTLEKVHHLFNINVSNVINTSEVTQKQLFDLYEAYNTKEKEHMVVYKCVAYVVGTLIVLSNLTVVISSGLILRKGQQPKNTYLLLGNVSLADTIIGISIILGASVDSSKIPNSLCIFQIGTMVCPAIVSIFSVGLIAVDRYIYILHGLYYQRWFSTTKVRIGIVCIWIIGIIITCIPAMGWTGSSFRNFRCWYIALFPPSLLIILSITVLSIIILVCVLYLIILHSAVKIVNKTRELNKNNIFYVNKAFEGEVKTDISETITISISQTSKERDVESFEMHETCKTNIKHKENGTTFKQKISNISLFYRKTKAVSSHPSKLKAVRTVLLVTFCFVFTWAPYYVAIIMYVKCDIMSHGYDCVPLEIITLGPLFILGVSNCLCDPLIYGWRHTDFKQTLNRIFWKYMWSKKS